MTTLDLHQQIVQRTIQLLPPPPPRDDLEHYRAWEDLVISAVRRLVVKVGDVRELRAALGRADQPAESQLVCELMLRLVQLLGRPSGK